MTDAHALKTHSEQVNPGSLQVESRSRGIQKWAEWNGIVQTGHLWAVVSIGFRLVPMQ